MVSRLPGTRGWSGTAIEAIIDRELDCNPELRSGLDTYAGVLQDYRSTGDRARLVEAIVDLAARGYRAASPQEADLVTFSDGNADFLFDLVLERTLLVWGVSRSVMAGGRDRAYHAGYPRAGDGLDKGHAWSHAQGGREGGPNYFRRARRLNQARSDSGRLWRAIERYLATTPGVSAFVRLIYGPGDLSDQPENIEYGILLPGGDLRAVIFPNGTENPNDRRGRCEA